MSDNTVNSSFTVQFSSVNDFKGLIKLEAHSDNPSPLLPGDSAKFLMYHINVDDIKIKSTIGNIKFLETVELVSEEVVTVTSEGAVNTKYPIVSLTSATLLGTSENYGGIEQNGTDYEVIKSDNSIPYILAVLMIKYTTSADVYELSQAILSLPEYEAAILAFGTQSI